MERVLLVETCGCGCFFLRVFSLSVKQPQVHSCFPFLCAHIAMSFPSRMSGLMFWRCVPQASSQPCDLIFLDHSRRSLISIPRPAAAVFSPGVAKRSVWLHS